MEAPALVPIDEVVPERLLNRDVVAERLDCNVSTLAKMVRDGRFIPPLQIGNRPRWREADVNAWIAENAAAAMAKPKR